MSVAIVWFRRDLRLADHPALLSALEENERVIPLYIHNEGSGERWTEGSASRWWLHHSLAALEHALASKGSGLLLRQGNALEVLTQLCGETGANRLYWNRLYDPDTLVRDREIKQTLQASGIEVRSYNSALLYEPWEILKGDRQPYRIFTPFWKSMQARGAWRLPEPCPARLPARPEGLDSVRLESLGLRPRTPWDAGFYPCWQVGESGAWQTLEHFLDSAIAGYPSDRDIPGEAGTSRLSPHLHFGEISPRQIVARIMERSEGSMSAAQAAFVREIAWREFAYHLLFHFPHTAEQPLDERFLRLPWREDYADELARWQRGETGYPIIDAGLRELWQTGWMHNRVRMIAASLLTKNLLIPWQAGAAWFWDTLVDADLACNTLGWQWTAGCGADAAPFFRLFNPVLQGKRFDPEGRYVRRWVPELSRLPGKFIHAPWEAGDVDLAAAGVQLGVDYPPPMVDLKGSRERALAAFASIKS